MRVYVRVYAYRTWRVRNPRASRKDSSGASGAPISFWTFATSCMNSAEEVVTEPARMSEWPPMYLCAYACMHELVCIALVCMCTYITYRTC